MRVPRSSPPRTTPVSWILTPVSSKSWSAHLSIGTPRKQDAYAFATGITTTATDGFVLLLDGRCLFAGLVHQFRYRALKAWNGWGGA